MLRVFLVFLSLRLSFALPAALACPSLYSLIAWCAPWSTRGDRRSVSVADKSPPLSRRGLLAGFICILLTRISTTERRVGEGRFFFVLPPCLLFPLFYFAWRCAQSLRAIAQEGCWRCLNPLWAMPLHYRNEGCYPPRKPHFHPPSAASLRRNGELGRGGSFSFRPLCLLFPLFYICLAACTVIVCNCTRGVLALCVQNFVGASALRRSLERCRRGQRVGVGATAENTGANARKRGAFCTASPVRLRERSTSCVVEPCRRRAREEVERHGRERDKCRAKT